jgi:cysteinyl-tRNA synthetase
MFEFVKKVSHPLAHSQLNEKERDRVLAVMKKIDSVLGVMCFDEETIGPEARALFREREQFRMAGKWKESDEIRSKLLAMGIEVADTPEGMTWRLK